MNTLKGYFKVTGGDVRPLEFGPDAEFNGPKGGNIFRATLKKQLTDSFEVVIERRDASVINEFKLTNQNVLTWDDYWLDSSTGLIADPGIKKLNLSRNNLVYCNINTLRPRLEQLDLSRNTPLKVLHLHECVNIRSIDISGCKSLENISLGDNKLITTLNAKDCEMTSSALEQLLRDFTPVVTSSSNEKGAGIFRTQYNTLLDLRGNNIDWSNKKIASKIRLLLTNNWNVKWSNTPPTDVIPLQLYSKLVESALGASKFK